MSTPAQATANLANAQASTGPRTPQGKAASSLNSLKHGLTAKTVLLPTEDPAEYQAFAAGILADLAPDNTVESALVQEITDLQWRILRVSSLEARALAADAPDLKALSSLGLHASRMKRQYSASLKEFLQLRALRIHHYQTSMEQACLIRRAEIILKRPTDLSRFGFVFSVDDVDAMIRDCDALAGARQTLAGPSPAAAHRNL